MPIFLDDQAVELEGADLSGVIDSASRKLADEGRVVVEVRVDGQVLVDDDLDAQLSASPVKTEIRLYSADPIELAVSTLAQVRTQLDTAREAQAEAAELFQQDQPKQAVRRVADAVGVWQQTQQAVLHSAVLVGVDLNEQKLDDKPVSETINALADQLRSLRDQLTAGDTVGLADALAFEWPQTIDRWQHLIDQLITWVRDR